MSSLLSEQIVPFPADPHLSDTNPAWQQVSASLRYVFSRFSLARERIVPRLLHTTRHAGLLSNLPHRCLEDLAVCYVLLLELDSGNMACAYISNEHLAAWPDVTEADLFDAATENGPKLLPAIRMDIADPSSWPPAGALPPEDPAKNADDEASAALPRLLALTNVRQQFGASVILYPGVLSRLADTWKDDLMILPSSIHEMLALPASDMANQNPDSMIREINDTVLLPEDILSDHCYLYRRSSGRLVRPVFRHP